MFAKALFGGLAALMTIAATPASAEPDNLFKAFGDVVRWYHLYSADDGKTHIEEIAVPVAKGSYGMTTIFDSPLRRGVIAYWPDGFVSEWHYATNKNVLLYLQGTQIIDIGDGKEYRLPPGVAVLADNWTGLGHRFRCEAKTEAKACVVLQLTVGDLDKKMPLRPAPK